MNRGLLTAALIAKNEEKYIGACLASLAGFVDEIVLVDTGSTDRTRQIACEAGARVYDFAWVDDFSAARNRALDLATGEWILYIDADERLRPDSATDLLERLSEPAYVGYEVLLHPHHGFTPYWILRLFRNRPSIRFRGVIHENIWPALQDYRAAHGGKVGRIGLVLDHDGYDGDQEHKDARNLPLLLKYLEQDPTRVYCWCHLANIYAGMEKDSLAEQAWERALALVRERGPLAPEDVLPYVGLIRRRLELNQDAETLLTEARSLFRSDVRLEALRGRMLMQQGEFTQAIRVFETIAERGALGDYDHGAAYDLQLFSVHAYEAIAWCYFRLGNYAESRRYYAMAAAGQPDKLEYRVKQALCAQLESAAISSHRSV